MSTGSQPQKTIHVVRQSNAESMNQKKLKRRYHKERTTKTTTVQTDLVVNLSSYQLTNDDIQILSMGLKFIPTPKNINKTEVLADIKKFSRRIRLKEFFHDKDAASSDSDQYDFENNYDNHEFRKQSKFTPKAGREPALDLYLKHLERTIMQAKPHHRKSNVSKTQRDAIISLRKKQANSHF